jgi:NAD(P) transhydrogenase
MAERPWFAPLAPTFEASGFCEGNNPARSSEKLPHPLSSSPTILRDADSWSTSENSAEEFVTASDSFDLIVIGPAGEKGGAQAAYFGKRVAVIERAEHMGGSCINTGTVPSKTLRESALYFSGLKQRGLYGIDYSLKENLTVHDFMHHEREVVDMERRRILKNLALHDIELVPGQAAFVDPHTVAVSSTLGTRQLKGEVILISTGSKPHRPPEIAFDDIHTFDSDTFLQMDRIPKSLAVIGGGVIGCEYASIFKALGVDVTLVDGRDRLLPFLDYEISDRLRDRLAALGMHFLFNERPVKTENSAGGVRLTMKSGKTLETDAALFAAGRRAAVDGLALEKTGLAINDRGYIPVDEHYRTAVPHIYAAGDVIGFPALASTSMEQGRVAVCHAFGLKYKERVASLLPMGIYTIPEISAAGETEESCKEKKIDYAVGRALYENNARGHITGDTAGMLKLIFARDDKKLLGVSIIGENATELIHVGMMVLDNGLTIDEFIEQVFNYPTLSETYKYAAYDGLGNLAGHKLREG